MKSITSRNATRAASGSANQSNFSYSGANYSWDWQDVHFVNCNYGPPVDTPICGNALSF